MKVDPSPRLAWHPCPTCLPFDQFSTLLFLSCSIQITQMNLQPALVSPDLTGSACRGRRASGGEEAERRGRNAGRRLRHNQGWRRSRYGAQAEQSGACVGRSAPFSPCENN